MIDIAYSEWTKITEKCCKNYITPPPHVKLSVLQILVTHLLSTTTFVMHYEYRINTNCYHIFMHHIFVENTVSLGQL